MALKEKKFLSWLLVPAIVLAHLFCACAPSASAYTLHAEPKVASIQDCDDDGCDAHAAGGHHDDHDAPGQSHHSHDCKCVNDAPATSTSDRVSIPQAELCHLPWAALTPSTTDLLTLASSHHFFHGSPWLTDPSPPPNHLLRVKCTLQI